MSWSNPVPNYAGRMFDPNPFGAASRPAAVAPPAQPVRHSSEAIVNGTSVVAVRYGLTSPDGGGVVMAADTLGSYGALAMFKSLQRIRTVGKHTLVGAGGEYSDFQSIMDMLGDVVDEEREHDDGATLKPQEIFNMLAQVMYNARNKMDPFYNQLVVAGHRDGHAFLGYTDLHGSNYVDDTVATGYGAHIARPLLRKYFRPDLTKDEAIKLVEMCMTVLYYRDKATINKIQFSVASAAGVEISAPRELRTEWTNMEKPSNAAVQTIVRITQAP